VESKPRIKRKSVNVKIEACHLIPFSVGQNDHVSNGIAFCPNLHRAFDKGLIGIDENCRVTVSTNFNESKSVYIIKIFDGKETKLPNQKSYLPLKNNFAWHLEHIFKSG
jgi:putative restriction endonuclease